MRLTLISLCLMFLITSNCEKLEAQEDRVNNTVQLIQKLEFVKNTKTGLCFAVSWGGSFHGGPILTYEPPSACEFAH